ncbi:MAG: hypothetical protein ACF8AM_21195 [Rhodopirellula sp. JB055]|uniref:hypothetical protein n=1 Tax=Rhodopirellula sp. JB055 TaxID=3342846 RepID=UPI00370BD741
MQDWEWEIADSSRIDEYLNIYLDDESTSDERFTLMETIIQAFAELPGDLSSDPRWSVVLRVLDNKIDLHAYSVWYWADTDDDWDGTCPVTPFMRKLVSHHLPRLDPHSSG